MITRVVTVIMEKAVSIKKNAIRDYHRYEYRCGAAANVTGK
jgi:hypothetical protein